MGPRGVGLVLVARLRCGYVQCRGGCLWQGECFSNRLAQCGGGVLQHGQACEFVSGDPSEFVWICGLSTYLPSKETLPRKGFNKAFFGRKEGSFLIVERMMTVRGWEGLRQRFPGPLAFSRGGYNHSYPFVMPFIGVITPLVTGRCPSCGGLTYCLVLP